MKFRYGVSARYTGQIESFDTDYPMHGEVKTSAV